MKVSELIEELKNLPQDSWVCVMEEGNTVTIEMLEESSMCVEIGLLHNWVAKK